jgi:hypothetical protein
MARNLRRLEHDLKEVDAGSWKRSCSDQQLRAR